MKYQSAVIKICEGDFKKSYAGLMDLQQEGKQYTLSFADCIYRFSETETRKTGELWTVDKHGCRIIMELSTKNQGCRKYVKTILRLLANKIKQHGEAERRVFFQLFTPHLSVSAGDLLISGFWNDEHFTVESDSFCVNFSKKQIDGVLYHKSLDSTDIILQQDKNRYGFSFT